MTDRKTTEIGKLRHGDVVVVGDVVIRSKSAHVKLEIESSRDSELTVCRKPKETQCTTTTTQKPASG